MKYFLSIVLAFTVLITFNTTRSYAQENKDIAIQLGDHNQPFSIDKAAHYEISRKQLLSDPVIHIYSKGQEYTVTEYQLSILPQKSELLGPYRIVGEDISTAINKNKLVLSHGSRVYIEGIKAVCNQCNENKEITAPGITIKLK